MATDESMQRNDVIDAIRKALQERSGKAWSVTGGRGTGWGWLRIDAPPRRRTSNADGTGAGSYATPEDRAELARLLGYAEPVHCQGVSVAASHAHYREFLSRARTGTNGGKTAEAYWD
jgi:hypothetical protein